MHFTDEQPSTRTGRHRTHSTPSSLLPPAHHDRRITPRRCGITAFGSSRAPLTDQSGDVGCVFSRRRGRDGVETGITDAIDGRHYLVQRTASRFLLALVPSHFFHTSFYQCCCAVTWLFRFSHSFAGRTPLPVIYLSDSRTSALSRSRSRQTNKLKTRQGATFRDVIS